jgi:hypothetical protein
VISLTSKGTFSKTEASLRKMAAINFSSILESAGKAGAAALARATPRDTGLVSSSWTFEVAGGNGSIRLIWHNTDIESGFPVAIMLQLGYSTGTGGYVQGRDYINPAIEPIFDKIQADVWKAVTSA